jgi:glucose-6-phosphate 1-dehydrogenase
MGAEIDEKIAFVIFGITGDLAHRKLLPALYELFNEKYLPGNLTVVGFARRTWSDQELKENLRQAIHDFARSKQIDDNKINVLTQGAHYICSNFDDSSGYDQLASYLAENGFTSILYYLSTPPEAYIEIIRKLGEHKEKVNLSGWTRIVIEKPYGRDYASADNLEEEVHKVFSENQIYRIDHYLGKETVQNIHVFRFANGIFEPLWNRRYVDHVQITVSESVGVGTRAGYYETSGVIRDMFQNHLLQLVSLTAMEAPVAFNADAVRDEKVKVLKSLRPLKGADAMANTYRAQYVSGSIEGKRVYGYKDEQNVPPGSTVETYLAAKLFIDNWRWAGVPFYVRSGKRMPCRLTEIAIQFRQIPLSLFNWHNMAGDAPNALILNIQPDEGITLTFGAKKPGPVNQIAPVRMNFSYQGAFGDEPPEAYERLLQDCLYGDATLFTRSDEVKAQWTFTTHILEAWQNNTVKNLPVYEAGTWGPPGVEEFIRRDGRTWRDWG